MIAIIPARGNSKGLSQKNLRQVEGKTLLDRAIEHAKQVVEGYNDYCGQIIVTSDDRRMLDMADTAGALPFKRSPELAEDTSTLKAVVGEVVRTHKLTDDLLILLPTYPFREVETTRKFIEFWKGEPFAESALCCYGPVEDHPAVCFYADEEIARPVEVEFAWRRQERQPVYRVYHYLVACHSRTLRNLDDGFFGKTSFYKLDERPLDIDTQADLDRANGGASSITYRSLRNVSPSYHRDIYEAQ